MELSYSLVLLAAIAQFILGALWYSPLMFGKWWMQIMECDNIPKEELQKMQKEMMPFYGAQFLLTLFTTFAFANFMMYATGLSVYHAAWWIWIGFVAPVQIGTVIWGRTKRQFWMKQIFVMLSFQFVAMMLMAFILSF